MMIIKKIIVDTPIGCKSLQSNAEVVMSFWCLFLLCANGDEPQVDVLDSMKVEYVLLDVFAHDADGHLIDDLTRDDFEIREGRKSVQIDLFDTVDYRFAPPPIELEKIKEEAGPDAQIQVHPQTFILVLEFSTAQVNQIRETMAELKAFFGELQVRPNVNFFLLSLDHGKISQNFTNQPAIVLQDLVAYEQRVMKDPGGNLIFTNQTKLSYLESELNDCLRYITGYSDSGNVFEPQNSGSKVREYNNCITAAHDRFMNLHASHTDGILKSLEQLIAVIAGLPGMKSMYLVSPGFSLRPGNEGSALTRSYADRIKSGTYTPSNQGQSEAATPANISTVNFTNQFNRVAHAAMANRIIFHSFRFGGQNQFDRMGADHGDGGLSEDSSMFFGLFSEEMNRGLRQLSETTGGRFVPESALGPSLDRVLNDHSFHYVIGYPKPSGRKRFRKITVDCKREGVVLSYRSGYFDDPKKAK